LNILIVTNSNNDIRSSRRRLLNELRRLNIPSELLYFSNNLFSEGLYKNLQSLWLFPVNVLKYAVYVLKYKPETVHSFKLLPNILGFLFSPMYSWHAHVYGLGMFAEVDRSLVKSLLFYCYTWILKRARVVFVQNSTDKLQLEDRGCICELIPGSGIDELGLSSEDNRRFIMVGRPVKSKGFELGIEAFCELCDSSGESYLLEIYGVDITEISSIYFGKRNLTSYNIKFQGEVWSKEEIYLKGGTLLFLSTYAEGFPRAVLEAWSYGIYVIALRNRGLNDHEVRMSIALTLLPELAGPETVINCLINLKKFDPAEIQRSALRYYSYQNVINQLVSCT